MSKSKVIKNGSLYMFGNLFNKAISFITVPIFTRMLTTEEYGIVNTYNAWVPLLAVFVGLSLGNSVRNAYVDYRKEIGEYISSIFTLAFINFLTIVMIFILIKNHIEFEPTLMWLCLMESFFNFIVNTAIMRYMMEEKAGIQTILMVLPNLVGAILSVTLILLMSESKYYGRIIGTCLSTSVAGFIIGIGYILRYKIFVNKDYWKYALPISIPLIFHGLSCNVLGTSDRIIITYYCGSGQTGIYSLIYNLGMVANVITAAAEAVWIPRMTRDLQQKDYNKFNREVRLYVYFVLFFLCGLLTVAPEMVLVLGGEKYKVGTNMIFPIVASYFIMFIYGIFASIEFYYKKTKMIATATVVAAVLNLALNVIFIPQYGAVAAAYTTLISYFVSFILHSIDAHKIDNHAAPYKLFALPLVVFLVSGIITTIFLNQVVLRYIIMISCGGGYVLLLGKKIRGGIQKNE